MSTCETVCSCCMERPIWPEAHAHGYEYCEECSMCEECSECWSGISEPHLIWESALCSRCERSEKLSEWLDETIEEIRRTAESHGWRLVGDDASEVSEAHYLVFERGDEERGDEEDLKIRVADHPERRNHHSASDFSVERGWKESLDRVLAALAAPH